MPVREPKVKLPEKDRLVTRPEGELPTPLDPQGPEARGAPADPRPDPSDADATSRDIDRTT
jgi:hypothetical protein